MKSHPYGFYVPALRFSMKVPGLTLGSAFGCGRGGGIPRYSLTPGIFNTPT